jgi:hypothetical protein
MGPVVIVIVLPFTQPVVKQVNIVSDAILNADAFQERNARWSSQRRPAWISKP